MEIYSYCCYILISCALFYTSSVCKSISLNDIIAAEERRTSKQTPQLKETEINPNTQELPKTYKSFALAKHVTSGSLKQANQKLSPLRYRKTFQIRTPLRPKKIKYLYKPRSKRLNSATKREIDDNGVFDKKYIPLLKSLSILFNNVLRADSGDDSVTDFHNKRKSISRSDECPCARQFKYKPTYREPLQTATPFITSSTSAIPTKNEIVEVTETSSTSTYNTVNDNISPLRRNQDVPLLSPRDSISIWRNDNGFSEGSVTTYNRNIEGHISRNNGNDENNNSRRTTTESYTENYQQYTDGSSGNNASCNGSRSGIERSRYITAKTACEKSTFETSVSSNETFGNDRRDSTEYKGFDKLETRRNKTESRIFLSQSSSRLRRFESLEETTEILWQIESPKESLFDITYNFTRDQRFSNRDGSVAPEDKEYRRTNQKLTLDDVSAMLMNTTIPNFPHEKDKQKIVVIYDGYSIARDVNGENKLTEKAYRIHS